MKGLHRSELVLVLGVVAAFGILGNFDYAFELEREAEEKEARPARVISLPPTDAPTYWRVLEPSGNPATFEDCAWARLTINHDACYSTQPCALKRICYGQIWTAL